jgi:putative DNA primase/helicase
MQFIIQKKSFHKDGETTTYMKSIGQVDSIVEILLEPEKFQFTDSVNLFMTQAHCTDHKTRKTETLETLPFDIDKCDTNRWQEYCNILEKVLGITNSNYFCINSGNGLHVGVWLKQILFIQDYAKYKLYYTDICSKLENEFKLNNLPFKEVDRNFFAPSFSYRLPLSINIKEGVKKPVILLSTGLEPADLNLLVLGGQVGLTDLGDDQVLDLQTYNKYSNTADRKSMTQECEFLKWCYNNQEEVKEPQWYAMLNLITRAGDNVEDSRALAHDYSRNHPKYSIEETDKKFTYALSRGPRRCSSIDPIWEGCDTCKHYGKVDSPILIIGENHIGTINTGFYTLKKGKNGVMESDKPCYQDLMKYFAQLHPFITESSSKLTYIYDDNYWQYMQDIYIEEFAQLKFQPVGKEISTSVRLEFKNLVQTTNVKAEEFFNLTRKTNLLNGVYDAQEGKLLPHDMKYGFRYKLPYDYNPEAKCPTFDKYMKDVTCGDITLEQIILEFLGVALFNEDAAKVEKALILTGEGSNGKSVLCDLIRKLTGDGNYSAIGLSSISKPAIAVNLRNKLINISEEEPDNKMLDSSTFKNLVTGGDVNVHIYYKGQFAIKNNAKLVITANRLPPTSDGTHGLFRRLLIIAFNATFSDTDGTRDPHMRDKLELELSGIFNKIANAYTTFLKTYHFSESVAMSEAVADYKQETSSFTKWVDECVTISTGTEVEVQDAFLSYNSWCEKYKDRFAFNLTAFSRKLPEIFPKENIERKRTANKRHTIIKGFKFNKPSMGGNF